jgi:hypothetical protein
MSNKRISLKSLLFFIVLALVGHRRVSDTIVTSAFFVSFLRNIESLNDLEPNVGHSLAMAYCHPFIMTRIVHTTNVVQSMKK